MKQQDHQDLISRDARMSLKMVINLFYSPKSKDRDVSSIITEFSSLEYFLKQQSNRKKYEFKLNFYFSEISLLFLFSNLNIQLSYYYLIFERFNQKKMWCCIGQPKERKVINGKFRKPYYSIASTASGKVLDIAQNSGGQNLLVIKTQNKGDTQKFEIQQKGSDYFIRTKKGKQYLTVQGPINGSKLYFTTQDYNQHQKFRIQQSKNGQEKYYIYTFFGKVLDVAYALTGDNSMVTQYDFSGKPHQGWTLIPYEM